LLDDTRAKIEYAQAYLQQKRPAEALASAQGALESVQRSPLRAYYQTLEADSLLWLAEAQIVGGDLSAATANLEQALRLRQANDDQNSPWIAQVQIALAKCLLASGNRQRSRTMLASAAAIQNTHRVLGSQFKRPLQEMQTRLAARAH
jgi:tetratricopeptide (TPR) repeat protein